MTGQHTRHRRVHKKHNTTKNRLISNLLISFQGGVKSLMKIDATCASHNATKSSDKDNCFIVFYIK